MSDHDDGTASNQFSSLLNQASSGGSNEDHVDKRRKRSECSVCHSADHSKSKCPLVLSGEVPADDVEEVQVDDDNIPKDHVIIAEAINDNDHSILIQEINHGMVVEHQHPQHQQIHLQQVLEQQHQEPMQQHHDHIQQHHEHHHLIQQQQQQEQQHHHHHQQQLQHQQPLVDHESTIMTGQLAVSTPPPATTMMMVQSSHSHALPTPISGGGRPPQKRSKKDWNSDPNRLTGQHFPVTEYETKLEYKVTPDGKIPSGKQRNLNRGYCVICTHKSTVYCKTCHVYLCVKAKVGHENCFTNFHTKVDIMDCVSGMVAGGTNTPIQTQMPMEHHHHHHQQQQHIQQQLQQAEVQQVIIPQQQSGAEV